MRSSCSPAHHAGDARGLRSVAGGTQGFPHRGGNQKSALKFPHNWGNSNGRHMQFMEKLYQDQLLERNPLPFSDFNLKVDM